MKLRIWTSIILFFSSYSPLALIIIVKDYDFGLHKFKHEYTVLGIGIFVVLSLLLLLIVMKNIRGGFYIRIDKISNCSNELINYTIPYIVSFLNMDIGNLNDVIPFLILICLLCLLTIKTQSVFVNPILALWGYGLYDVEFKESNVSKYGIFLSKEALVTGKAYTIQGISKFMYLVTAAIVKEES